MALREILQFPDPRLKLISEPIEEITDEIRSLASDMLDVMYDEPGIGLAAPQIGESIRLVVVDTDWTREDPENTKNPMVLINPEITEADGEVSWEEGCLSVPDFTAEVVRSGHVVVKAIDLDGKEIEINAEELQAVCLQHEIDHLDGKLFIDRISRLKREMYVKKRKKQLLAEEQDEY